ncbi:alanyl-tRNA editing protein [Thalassospira sp. TSL5-1]|uniref:alanyl-tRNA editing protein n=1 Tax=Thalassospira sp. TSL5-1 TaxID=1544451 RepID=UPI00093D5FFC|nr:alanyl-tRNA editing protein [Thalassospira sp. TSL5-1]OKH89659.1 Ala-tRNA(Pro) hydrolase [Thalassospira sp. TSL5-1]
MTELLFRQDAYQQSCVATVTDHVENGVILDQTVFYATSGGQTGDSGILTLENGTELPVSITVKDRESGKPVHVIAEGHDLPAIGSKVTAVLDWETRYRHMRFHTCLHVLCSIVDGGVTGGNIASHKARLDFDMEGSPDKDELTEQLNARLARNAKVYDGLITVEELKANPDLVRTMSVQPPMDGGTVRTVTIEGIDYQPCGGTHVRNTSEIGRVRVSKIEKKGRQNRRINIVFDEQA